METSIATINITKRLIEQRAGVAFKISQAYLLREDASDWEYGECFKFAVLIHKGRKYFHSQWKESGALEIDLTAVNSIYERHSLHLNGPRGLLPEEMTTIEKHNQASRKWITENHSLPGLDTPTTINMGRVGPSTYAATR